MAYPTTLDTDSTLYVAVNNLFTTLTASYTSPAVTVSLSDASGFPSTGGIIYVEGERGTYTGKSGNDLTGVTGLSNNHPSGVSCELLVDASHHNVLKDALVAIQTHVGVTGSAVAGTVEKRLTDAIASIPTLTATAPVDLGVSAATGVGSTAARHDHVHSGLMADTAFGIKGSGDATKIVRFEVDGLTSGVTRTITVPDSSFTLFGTADTATLTNKTFDLTDNTLTGTIAEFNAACSDADFLSDAGVATLTNKTIDLTDNTLTGTISEFNAACSDADFVTDTGTVTLTNKTISLASNTVSGTLAQFNTAVSDADLASLAGAETLTNKTITTPVLTLANSANPTPTTEGDIQWDNDGHFICVGDGATTTYIPSVSSTHILSNKTLTSPKETRTAPTISGGTLTLDLSTASIFDVSLNAAITTLTISNPASSGTAHGFVLTFTADGTARAVTWGASVLWPSGTAPTLTSTNNKKDKFAFMTTDGGTTWHGIVVGQNF